jgi:hypothetical protein
VTRILSYVPTDVRRFLDNWKLWVGVAYFGLVAMIVSLYFVNARTTRAVALQAAAAARTNTEHRLNAQSDYHACVVSIPALRKINRFVNGVQVLHQALLLNAVKAHEATPPGSALYRQQVANIARLSRSVDAVSGVAFPGPTVAECRARRKHDLAHP